MTITINVIEVSESVPLSSSSYTFVLKQFVGHELGRITPAKIFSGNRNDAL